jgi:thiosulfate dehydrogenase [quinone] large subunit
MAVIIGRQEGDTLIVAHHYPWAALVWALTRIFIGVSLLWSFLDRAFGLGYPTGRREDGTIAFFGRDAWAFGGSPTTDFLASVDGPLAAVFRPLAGQAWVDWAFMLALLLIGTALVLGIGMRLACVGGVLLLVALYLASMPPELNPLVDHHLVYALVLIGLTLGEAGDTFGLGTIWKHTRLVERFPVLR